MRNNVLIINKVLMRKPMWKKKNKNKVKIAKSPKKTEVIKKSILLFKLIDNILYISFNTDKTWAWFIFGLDSIKIAFNLWIFGISTFNR